MDESPANLKALMAHVRELSKEPIAEVQTTEDSSLQHITRAAVPASPSQSAASQAAPQKALPEPPPPAEPPVVQPSQNQNIFAAAKPVVTAPVKPVAAKESFYAEAKKAAFTEARGDSHVDRVKISTKYAFVGSGQGGSRIAESFYAMGYPAIVVNTAPHDLKNINIPEENKMLLGSAGGAGKDPSQGYLAAEDNKENIYDLMRERFPDDVDHIFLCVGGGGGSGTGSVPVLLEVCHYLKKPVGMVLTLPKASEGSTVKKNAYNCIKQLEPQIASGSVSPLILVDNNKINSMHPNATVAKFWRIVNAQVTGLFHIFNVMSAQNSAYTSLDAADYRSIINAKGCIVFGVSDIKDLSARSAIATAIRENVKYGLLVEGFELEKSKIAGTILTGSPDLLDNIPTSQLDYAIECLNRLVGGGTLHHGIYEEDSPILSVYTMIGGLPLPVQAIENLNL